MFFWTIVACKSNVRAASQPTGRGGVVSVWGGIIRNITNNVNFHYNNLTQLMVLSTFYYIQFNNTVIKQHALCLSI